MMDVEANDMTASTKYTQSPSRGRRETALDSGIAPVLTTGSVVT